MKLSRYSFRSIRKWWIALPPNKQLLLREAAWRRRWHLAGGAAGLLVVMAVFLLTHLDESPVTGRTRLLVFSRENFLELADITAKGVRLSKKYSRGRSRCSVHIYDISHC